MDVEIPNYEQTVRVNTMNTSNDFSAFVDSLLDTSDEFAFNGKNDIGENIAGVYRHVQAGKAEFDDREYMFEA